METEPERNGESHSRLHMVLLTFSGTISVILLASLWLFLNHPNHRIAGIAMNALFLAFGSMAALLFSIIVLGNTINGSIAPKIGLPSGISAGVIAAYCIYRAFPIMNGV